MPLWDFLLNRFCIAEPTVAASTCYYESAAHLSRRKDKTDISLNGEGSGSDLDALPGDFTPGSGGIEEVSPGNYV